MPHSAKPGIRLRDADAFGARLPPKNRPARTLDVVRGQNITRAGAHNRQLMLHHIRAKGPVTRLELTGLTGLTPPAVFKITKDLIDEGLVHLTLHRDGSRGQPSSFLTINPDAAYAIGLNVDRNSIAFVVLDFGGNVREVVRQDVPSPSPTDVKEVLAKFYKASLKKYSTKPDDFVGIGLSIPHDLTKNSDPNLGVLWRAMSLEKLFTDITPLPVILENDAAAASIGEMVFGAGLEVDTFIYLHIGVELGSGLVIDRRYVKGRTDRYSELGNLPKVNPFKSRETALATTIENVASVDGFLAAFKAAGIPAAQPGDLDFDNAKVQDILRQWVGAVADFLYLPLLSTLSIINPDAVFIGGPLPPVVTDLLSLEVTKRLSLNIAVDWQERTVRPGKLTRNAAAVGAGVIAFRAFWDQNHAS